MLRDLDDDAVARKEGGQQGVEDVMERVVPGDDRADDAERHVIDAALLVEHLQCIARRSRVSELRVGQIQGCGSCKREGAAP